MGLRKVSTIDKLDHELCAMARQIQTIRQELQALREKDAPKRPRPKTNLIDPRTGKTFQTKTRITGKKS